MDNSNSAEFYEITEFVIDRQSFFCIWFSVEEEGFISENKNICVFYGFNAAKLYADSKRLTLSKEISTYHSDRIRQWADCADINVDCVEVLNFWKVIQDIAATTGLRFLGDKRSRSINNIYNKLFCGNNVLIDNEDDKYYPSWSKKEIRIIKKVLLNGLDVLKTAIQSSANIDCMME